MITSEWQRPLHHGLAADSLLIARIAAVLRRPAVQRWQERILGCVFLGFGASLATERL
jgi:threonine/homoserine/homoserine lactone efflux protein